ncbi:hypothetical protein BC628DRAFT_52904 [Trametes gibbosa]|nr:hypothetical protein BC628DRAFT_52904 [Trametes gibbosa]
MAHLTRNIVLPRIGRHACRRVAWVVVHLSQRYFDAWTTCFVQGGRIRFALPVARSSRGCGQIPTCWECGERQRPTARTCSSGAVLLKFVFSMIEPQQTQIAQRLWSTSMRSTGRCPSIASRRAWPPPSIPVFELSGREAALPSDGKPVQCGRHIGATFVVKKHCISHIQTTPGSGHLRGRIRVLAPP